MQDHEMPIHSLLRAELETRFANNLSRMGEACDASPSMVSKWVSEDTRRRSVPSPSSCARIAAALGLDPDYVLELAGHRQPREPRAEVDARRQAVRDQLDRWLAAVGPEYEQLFWNQLKAQAESTVALIQQIGTAVNANGEAAVNAAVSGRSKRGRSVGETPNGPLRAT